MTKLLMPSPENREACLRQLWDKLYIDDFSEEKLAFDYRSIQQDLDEQAPGKAACSSSYVSDDYRKLAHIARRKGQWAEADGYLRKSFAFICWTRELNHIARRAPDWPELNGDTFLMSMLSWQALSIQCGSPWFALWLAPHLHNQFGHPNPAIILNFYARDKPARRFMEVLQRCLVTGVWPSEWDLPALSAYGALLSACADEQAWPEALMHYCDWRIANCYGYAEMGASKRRRQSRMDSLHDVERIEQVFPEELFILKFAYERATGRSLTLDVAHPLLQTPMMRHPFGPVEPMYEDEWTAKLAALREAFAEGSPLREPVMAKFV